MSMPQAFGTILKRDGFITGFYSGFVPLLFKQIPYTIAKFVVQDEVANRIYRGLGAKPSEMSPGKKLGISCTSGFIAGVFAAICYHPADTLFSLMNKPGAGGEGSMFARMSTIAGEMGFYKLATQGLGARCIMYDSPRPIHAIAALLPTRRPTQDRRPHGGPIRDLRLDAAGHRHRQVPLPRAKSGTLVGYIEHLNKVTALL